MAQESKPFVGTVECDDPQYNQTSCYIANVILKDGTIEDYSASWSQIEDGRFIMKCYYNRMIPMDDIVGVVVNNEYLYFKNKNVSMKLFALPKHLIDNKSKGGEKLDFGKEKTRSH